MNKDNGIELPEDWAGAYNQEATVVVSTELDEPQNSTSPLRGLSSFEIKKWHQGTKKYNSQLITHRTCERTTATSRNNNENRNAPITANQRAIFSDT